MLYTDESLKKYYDIPQTSFQSYGIPIPEFTTPYKVYAKIPERMALPILEDMVKNYGIINKFMQGLHNLYEKATMPITSATSISDIIASRQASRLLTRLFPYVSSYLSSAHEFAGRLMELPSTIGTREVSILKAIPELPSPTSKDEVTKIFELIFKDEEETKRR